MTHIQRPSFSRTDATLRIDAKSERAESPGGKSALDQLAFIAAAERAKDAERARAAALQYMQEKPMFIEEGDRFARSPSPETPPLAPDDPIRVSIEQWLKGVRPGVPQGPKKK